MGNETTIFPRFKKNPKRSAARFFSAAVAILIAVSALPANGAESRVGDAIYETETGRLSFGGLSTTIGADSVERGADGSLVLRGALSKTQVVPDGISGDLAISTDSTERLLTLRWIYRSSVDGAELSQLETPIFEYDDAKMTVESGSGARKVADFGEMKALGTAGLTAVDGRSGSYMFLALARPFCRTGVVAGWTTTERASGIVFSAKNASNAASKTTIFGREEFGKARLDAGDEFFGETFAIGPFSDVRDGLELYADEAAARNDVKIKRPPVGYCTWYSDKNGGAGNAASTAEFARVAAEKLVPWGFNLFQIDDGWQAGDNFSPAKNFTAPKPNGPYRDGMKPVAESVNQNGLVAGLWTTPFAGATVDPYFDDKRDLFAQSAEDFNEAKGGCDRLNQREGEPYEAYWGGTCFDLTNPKTLEYIDAEIRQIVEKWGFKYIKADGLWTGLACQILYVNDEYRPDDLGKQRFFDPKATNVSAYRRGAKAFRAAAGNDVFVLGCTTSQNMRSLGASFGFVDGMRIGPDNGTGWGFDGGGICAGAVRGTPRYFLNGRIWWNDPDPVYVRDSIPLDRARVVASWTAIAGGLYLFADWLPNLSEERIDVLRRTMARSRFGSLGAARPIDLFENAPANSWILPASATDEAPERFAFGFFNWSADAPLEIRYPLEYAGLDAQKTYFAWDFWNDKPVGEFGKDAFGGSSETLELDVPAQSCRVLSVRETSDRPFLISTNRHLVGPAFEVSSEKWDDSEKTLTGTSEIVWNDRYELRIVARKAFAATVADAAKEPSATIEFCADEKGATVRDLTVRREESDAENAGNVEIWRISFLPTPGPDFSPEPLPATSVSDDANAEKFNVSVRWNVAFGDQK